MAAFNPFRRRGASPAEIARRVLMARRGVNVFDPASAMDFHLRSNESVQKMIGVPPPYLVSANERVENLQGMNLPRAEPAPSPDDVKQLPGAIYAPQFYGDAFTFPVVFAAAGDLLVLQRPNNTRTSLLIVNSTVVANIFYAFDRVADNLSCVPIVAGGNRLFDFSVPQGDLHVFSTGAGTVIIEYMNRKISQENYR